MQKKVVSRREFVKATTLASSAVILSACTPAPVLPVATMPVETVLATPNFKGVTIDMISLDGEDGQIELEAWRAERGITLAKSPFSSWDETFGKLKTDNFDIALVANPYVSLWGKAGVLTPLDIRRFTNWNDMFPALRDAEFLRDEAGNVYAVPIAWGDGPFIYDPARVSKPPASITELLDSKWKGRLTNMDDSILIFHYLAVAKGYPSPKLTKSQLSEVKEQAKILVGNYRAFSAGYQDATDLLVRGEVDLAISGWEAMLTWAAEKGTTLKFGFFEESHGGGWCDSLAIPANAVDVDAAYAYIDALISPDVNARLATNLISGTVNSKALSKVDSKAQIYDYNIVKGGTGALKFEIINPPIEAVGDLANKADWDTAWAEIRGG